MAWRGREPVCPCREDQLLGAQGVVILLWRAMEILFALRSGLGGREELDDSVIIKRFGLVGSAGR